VAAIAKRDLSSAAVPGLSENNKPTGKSKRARTVAALRLSPTSIYICIGYKERKEKISVSQNKMDSSSRSASPTAPPRFVGSRSALVHHRLVRL
jgi:hypothetical protein